MTADTLFADRYRLERRLGVGGMATVQLAMDTRLERHVAVKLLAEHLAEDRNFVSRFRREALAVARLVHPNIVQVFDFGADERSGRQYIVMEYVDGPSCAEILRELGPARARATRSTILTQACRGLDYAHRNGVVHRDVKPGNLLRSRDGGQVKLADFGIAKAAEQSDITKVGSVLGTAAYLSPEQARGEPAGPASDLYALGVVSYQLLAGRLPVRRGVAHRPRAPAGPPAARRRCTSSTPTSRAALSLAVDAGARRASPTTATPTPPRWSTRCADGLRGVAPEPTAATRAVADPTDATRTLRARPRPRAADAHAPPPQPPAAAGADRRSRRRRRGRAAGARPPAPRRRGRRARRAPARRAGCGACSRSCCCSSSWPRRRGAYVARRRRVAAAACSSSEQVQGDVAAGRATRSRT